MAARTANAKKIKDLEKQMKDLQDTQEHQGREIQGLKRRQDRLEKCTLLVLEHNAKVEALYAQAERDRQFANSMRPIERASAQLSTDLQQTGIRGDLIPQWIFPPPSSGLKSLKFCLREHYWFALRRCAYHFYGSLT